MITSIKKQASAKLTSEIAKWGILPSFALMRQARPTAELISKPSDSIMKIQAERFNEASQDCKFI